MNRFLKTAVLSIVATLLGSLLASAETVRCAECGMMVDTGSKFSARATQGKTVSQFCDIGDLLTYLKRTRSADITAEVKDHGIGAWMDAKKAFYVRAEKKFSTPMGWGIAAFSDSKQASAYGQAMDLDAALKGLK